MRKSSFEKLKEAKKREDKQLVINSIDEFYQSLLGGPMLPTQKRFIYGKEFCRAYKGPAGCAKTSTLAAFAWGRALLVPGTKLFISRADYNDLFLPGSTFDAINGMLDLLPKDVILDRDKSPPMKWWIKPATLDGAPDDNSVSQMTFMGLRDGLGSTQATVWLVDEADEIEELRAREIIMRLRAKGVQEDYCAGYVFNPPAKNHWLYTACTGKDAQGNRVGEGVPWMDLYEPEPQENIQNLPKGYYERFRHLSPEQRQRYVDGQWGATFPGLPVYRNFKQEIHVNRDLEYNPHSMLYRFWDFGYNRPVCIWAQMSPYGHLYVLKELIGHMEEIEPFALRVKAVTESRFPNADLRDYGDPAVKQHKDTGSSLAKLYNAGIQILYRFTHVDEGVTQIRNLLDRLIGGKPILQFNDREAPTLVDALKGGYHMDKTGDAPKKDGFYEHPADAYRYGIVNVFGGMVGRSSYELPENLSYNPEEDHG